LGRLHVRTCKSSIYTDTLVPSDSLSDFPSDLPSDSLLPFCKPGNVLSKFAFLNLLTILYIRWIGVDWCRMGNRTENRIVIQIGQRIGCENVRVDGPLDVPGSKPCWAIYTYVHANQASIRTLLSHPILCLISRPICPPITCCPFVSPGMSLQNLLF
jgi:hypothetical protein